MNEFNIYNKEYDLVRSDKIIYDIAIRSKERLSQNNIASFKEMIRLTAYNTSLEIWLDVFYDNPEMCELFKKDSNIYVGDLK